MPQPSGNVWRDPDTGLPCNPQNATQNDDKAMSQINVLGPAFDNPTSRAEVVKEEMTALKFGQPAAPPVVEEPATEPPPVVDDAAEEAKMLAAVKRLADRRKTDPAFADPRLQDIQRREAIREGGPRTKVMAELKKAMK